MISLKQILLEGINRQEVVDRVYPLIVKDLGKARKGTPKVEFHTNIYARLSGIEGMSGESNPHAEYDWDKNKIYLYTPKMTNEEEIIKALLHEYTHATQDPKKMEKYRKKGYANNPYEKEAHRAERNWKKYVKQIGEASRTARKKGQKKGSSKHSDLYTDEDPKGTIHGLGFKDAATARKGVGIINKAKRTHAHKVQATLVMKQRAKVAKTRTKDPEKKKNLNKAYQIWSAHLEKLKKKTKND